MTDFMLIGIYVLIYVLIYQLYRIEKKLDDRRI